MLYGKEKYLKRLQTKGHVSCVHYSAYADMPSISMCIQRNKHD
jgi:hypothetical protein